MYGTHLQHTQFFVNGSRIVAVVQLQIVHILEVIWHHAGMPPAPGSAAGPHATLVCEV